MNAGGGARRRGECDGEWGVAATVWAERVSPAYGYGRMVDKRHNKIHIVGNVPTGAADRLSTILFTARSRATHANRHKAAVKILDASVRVGRTASKRQRHLICPFGCQFGLGFGTNPIRAAFSPVHILGAGDPRRCTERSLRDVDTK